MRGFEEWTLEDVVRHNANVKKLPKYRNKVVEVKGEKFDSKKEFNRALELEDMCRRGEIKNLERQKKFILQPSFKINGKTIREVAYMADFVYETKDGELVVEDVKSPITRKNPVYRLKKKMLMYVHKIVIHEV